MSDALWIIGVAMTKFGRYPDKDLIDLGSEAALGALADAGLTIFDADVLAAGCLYETSGAGQRIQKQIGQTGIPVYNVANACATGATAFRVAAMAIKSGEASIGLAVGLEQMGKRGLLGAAPGGGAKKYTPSGRYGALGPVEGVLAGPVPEGVLARADHGRRDDRLSQHQADVLPDRRRGRRGRAHQRRAAGDDAGGSPQARDQGVRVGDDQ
jgi:acetyl-CoA acyltransferase